jgi:hypothetical protein
MNNSFSVLPGWIGEFLEHATKTPLIIVLLLILGGALIHFAWQYVARGVLLRSRLKRLVTQVAQQKEESPGRVKESLDLIFTSTPVNVAWKEYEETLHEQYEWVAGERRTVAVRATVSAHTFINIESVIDPRLGSEYFKHLPGIMTGLGIIGTFFGLIFGLRQFDPTLQESTAVVAGLKDLFDEVRYAFTFSGIAIGGAIGVTIIEKWLYSACAKWLGELNQNLDGLFRAGVGEEYLSNLVQASQENASQTRQLKESLVEDLKVLLTNLTERQVQASREMTTSFATQIEQSLQQPLQSLAETVRLASGQQTQATGAVLENLMTAFMAQMRESVGGQMSGLGTLLQQTAQSMGQVELSLRSLVDDMRKAGGETTTAATHAMNDLMAKLQEHQQQQGKSVVAATQVAMDKLQQAVSRMAEAQESANQRTEASVAQTVGAMQMRVDGLVAANQSMTVATRESMDRMQLASMESVEQLSASAARVERAVGSLGEVAERMALLAQQLAGLQAQTIQASQASGQATSNLATASQAMAGSVGRLSEAAVRFDAVAKVIATEADQRDALLKDLAAAAERSRLASAEFKALTDQVKQTLVDNVETFGTGMARVVQTNLLDYQKQLGDAISMLKNALEELAEYADGAKR